MPGRSHSCRWSGRCNNFTAFLAIDGIWQALLRSVEVAVLCMVLLHRAGRTGRLRARALRLPRCERLSPDDPADPRLSRRHPGAAAGGQLRAAGHLRHRDRRRAHSYCSGPAFRGAGHIQPVPRHPARTRGSRLGVRLLAASVRSAGSCCRWRCRAWRRRRCSPSCISWNEVFAASVLTVRHQDPDRISAVGALGSPLHVQFAGGFLLIIPSVLFIFLVRRYLFAMWGITSR